MCQLWKLWPDKVKHEGFRQCAVGEPFLDSYRFERYYKMKFTYSKDE